jgi:hypothetical protein
MTTVPPRAQDTGESQHPSPEVETWNYRTPADQDRQAKALIAQWLASPDPDWSPPVFTRADLDALDLDNAHFSEDGCPNHGGRS